MGDQKTDLAIERTILAHERTLMAWVRTATSLISFGFTIYKFFDYLRDSNQLASSPRHLFGPRAFATGMIAVGLIALVLGILTLLEVAVFYVPLLHAVIVPILLVLSSAKFALVAAAIEALPADGTFGREWLLIIALLGGGLAGLIALARVGMRLFWSVAGRQTPRLWISEAAPVASSRP